MCLITCYKIFCVCSLTIVGKIHICHIFALTKKIKNIRWKFNNTIYFSPVFQKCKKFYSSITKSLAGNVNLINAFLISWLQFKSLESAFKTPAICILINFPPLFISFFNPFPRKSFSSFQWLAVKLNIHSISNQVCGKNC